MPSRKLNPGLFLSPDVVPQVHEMIENFKRKSVSNLLALKFFSGNLSVFKWISDWHDDIFHFYVGRFLWAQDRNSTEKQKKNSHNQSYKAQKEMISREQKWGGSTNTRIISPRENKAVWKNIGKYFLGLGDK